LRFFWESKIHLERVAVQLLNGAIFWHNRGDRTQRGVGTQLNRRNG
jgi:hypothetical protein